MEVPVYLFTGFLESGKTKMIDETLADKRFQDKEKTLVLLCEEGEEEYDVSKYKGKVFIENVESPEELTEQNLKNLLAKHKAERVLVEYNGMWMTQSFYDVLPEDWFVYQEVMCVDSTTFRTYNANMRQLMFDKLSGCQVVFFNRCTPETDIMELHAAARAVQRQVGIVYEYKDGKIQQDEIVDPLPFDIEAPIVEIEDKDYAIWYRDMVEDVPKYDGKIIKVKGIVNRDDNFPAHSFAFGRMVMTCCEADTSYHALVATGDDDPSWKTGDWLLLTARIKLEKHKLYTKKGPVFHIICAERTKAPDPVVATFN